MPLFDLGVHSPLLTRMTERQTWIFRFGFLADAFSKMNQVTLSFQKIQAIAFSSQKSQGKSHASTVINTEILEKESVHVFTDPTEFFITVKPSFNESSSHFPLARVEQSPNVVLVANPWVSGNGLVLSHIWLSTLCFYLVIELDIESPLLQKLAVISGDLVGRLNPGLC